LTRPGDSYLRTERRTLTLSQCERVRAEMAEISRLLRLLAAQAAIVLFTSQTKVLGVLIYDLNESGDLAALSVLGIMMLVITFASARLRNG
jgi:ABC-type Fe3+ transport system permease subunit